MLLHNNNEIAVPRRDGCPQTLFDNFIRHEVVGHLRGAFCVALACALLEHELSIEKNLVTTDDGGAHRNREAVSQTSRPRRRRCRPPGGYLSIRQLAERADAALSTAYLWVETGRIPAARWRGRLIVSEKAVDAFLAIKPLKQVTDSGNAEVNHD